MKEFLFLGDSITDCDHSFDPQNLGEGYVRILAKELGHFDGTAKILIFPKYSLKNRNTIPTRNVKNLFF